MADPLKERISLLTMGEAQGKLRPEHIAELNRYRAQGLAKGSPAPMPGPQGQPAQPQDVDISAPQTIPKGAAAQGAYTKVAAARQMLAQLGRVKKLYSQDMGETGLAGLKEYNPMRPANQRFDGAVSAIPLLARQAFRVQGSGADSDRELKLITDALPNRWSFDETNKERFSSLDSVLHGFIDTYGGMAGYSPAQLAKLQAEGRAPPKRSLPAPPPRQPANNAAAALKAKYGLQ